MRCRVSEFAAYVRCGARRERAEQHASVAITSPRRRICRLAIAAAAIACRGHGRRRLHLRRAVRGADQLPVALRAAAGAALSRLSRGRVGGAAGRCRAARAGQARRARCRGAVRCRLLDGVRGARRRRQRHRRIAAALFIRAVDRRGRRHHRDGPAFSWHHADRIPVPAGARGDAKAGRAVGCLCDGACLRLRLDALHRADPGGDPGGGGIGSDGDEGRRPARGLFARAWRAVPDRCARGRTVRKIPARASRLISPMSSASWGPCSC